MAGLTISDLNPAGLNLLSDSEGYLADLTEMEQDLQGGLWMIGMTMALAGGFGVGFAGAAIYQSGTKCGL